MRVLQLGPYPPPHGGVQTNLVALREYLRRQGIPCAVINLTRFRRTDVDDVYYPANAAALMRLLVRLRYDIVHLHIGGHLTPRLLGLALVCCLVPRAKAVLTFHSGGYPSSPAGQTARPGTLRGFVFRRFNGIIGVNAEIVAMFRRFGVAPERLRLILPHTRVAADPAVQFPEPLGGFFQQHEPVLLTVGLLEPEYDLGLQIDALEDVRRRFPNAGLAIVGAGSLEADLRARIASKPYAEHLLLCGDVPHAITLRALAECAVLLRTTLYDGDAISVREALDLGTPVVATDNGMRPPGVHLIPKSDPQSNRAALVESIARRVEEGRTEAPAAPASEDNLEAVLRFYRELSSPQLQR